MLFSTKLSEGSRVRVRSTLLKFGCVLCVSLLAVATLFAATDLKVIGSHKSWAENLAELLRFVAEQYRVPIVAELVNPVPSHLVIESGQDTAIGLLGNVLKQLPGYKYEVSNGQTIHANSCVWQRFVDGSGRGDTRLLHYHRPSRPELPNRYL